MDDQAINSLIAYQQAISTASIVSITDKKGRIVYANDLFCLISKYAREELIGKNHRLINSGHHSKEFFKVLWNEIKAGNIWHGEIQNRAKDGTYCWVDTTISPILNNNGEIVQYLSIRSLITERKNLEKEREQLISELTHKYNELMQFNYIVSHNLRAPVSNLVGLTTLLTDEAENCNTEAKSLINYVSQSVLSLDQIIKDLTQVLSARSPINQKLEYLSLLELIESVKNNLATEIAESGTVISLKIPKNADRFRSIKTYVQSVLYNLISNGIKYCKDQTHPLIIIKAERIDRNIILTVTDNGIGMDLKKIGSQIFGLYKKFNFSKEGRGLGLHMTKTQVESLGGTIAVNSQDGYGTTFIVTFPI